MPLEKLSDEPRPCFSLQHNPPTHMVYQPGTYKWTCPDCGAEMIFTVNGVYL